MSISFVAMNRILEERAAEDETIRRRLERNGKRTLSDGRVLSDEALVEKLHSLGLTELNRDWLDRFSQKAPSAQILATGLTEYGELHVAAAEQDWVWIALVCLWERWFPDRPNFEMLDDWMQAGYEARKRNQTLEAARLWLRVWRGIETLMADFAIGSIEEFDDWFGGTQSVCNWVQDFSSELFPAAREDRSFALKRLSFCRRVLEMLERTDHDQLTIENFRRDLAESHAELGDYQTVDGLYAQWLEDDARWGWGWIGWSDVYYTFAPEGRADAARAEQILLEGLAVPGVIDREHLVERLESLYEAAGRLQDLTTLRDSHARPSGSSTEPREHGQPLDEIADLDVAQRKADEIGGVRQTPVSSAPLRDVAWRPVWDPASRKPSSLFRNTTPRVGRNDPCPCGSGKKHKKCCGAG